MYLIIWIIHWYTILQIKQEDFYRFYQMQPKVDIRCVRRPRETCDPVFFYFMTFRIIMEIWEFCLEISLKNHGNFSRLVCGNPAWVTVNNDFGSRVRRFANNFYEWRSHKWKSLANHITSDPKSRYSWQRLYYFISWHAILCPEHTISLKQLLITDFAIVGEDGLFWLSIVTSPQLICDVTRTWGAGIVTSYSSSVLARTNWQKGNLH